MNRSFRKGSLSVNKSIKIALIGSLALLMTACSSDAKANKNLTAEEIFEKGKLATEKLEKVHTDIVFEDGSRTDKPEERTSMKFSIKSDANLQPLVLHQVTNVQKRGESPWIVDLYKTTDEVIVNDDRVGEWEKTTTDSVNELFGKMVEHSNPTLNLSLFDEFKDDFEVVPIDYGYALKLSLDREQYKRFNKVFLGIEEKTDEFNIIHRMNIEIQFDIHTMYTTDFKVAKEVTTYSNGNFRVYKQKLNVAYSRFDDTKDITVPQKVLQAN